MKKEIAFITTILIMTFPVYAVETFNTGYVEGIAPITVDGDISDWAGMDLPIYPILNQLNFRNVFPAKSDIDLSASFKCFADDNYFYVAIMVTDDIVTVGNHPSGMGWNDDSAEICFDGDLKDTSKPYFDMNDGQVRVTADKNGIALIEGAIPYLYESQPPYFWEARGVRGGFKETTNGYTLEAAIPLSVLGWDKFISGKKIGLNIRIFDDDNEINAGMIDHGLTWVEDIQNTSFWKTQYYNIITLSEKNEISGNIQSSERISTTTAIGERDIVLELTKPDKSNYNDIIDMVLNDMMQEGWNAALSRLNTVKDRVWALPLIGVIQNKEGKVNEGYETLLSFYKESPDERAREWAKNEIVKTIKANVDSLIIKEDYSMAISLVENGLNTVDENNIV